MPRWTLKGVLSVLQTMAVVTCFYVFILWLAFAVFIMLPYRLLTGNW